MARIPFVDVEDPSTDPKAATLLRVATDALDMELNVWKAMANHPEIMEATLNLLNVAYFNTGPGGLSLRQAELTYTTAAFTNECHY
jgi:alkylhydroperoxidase family enzyme